MARRTPKIALVVAVTAALVPACTDQGTPPLVAPQPPAPPPVVAPVAPPTAEPVAPLPPDAFDPSQITLVLDDPRLAPVKAEVDREAYAKAATELAGLLTTAAPSPEDRRSWLFQLGRLRALGGDPTGAAKAFEESASTPWALADDAHLEAAQWEVGVGQFDAALASLAAISPGAALGGAADLAAADAYLGKNDIAAASKHFDAYLDGAHGAHGGSARADSAVGAKHGAHWVTVALRYATALLNHPSHAHSEQAVKLARRVLWESSGGQGAAAAIDLEKRALETLPSKRRKALGHLSPEQQLGKARGLLHAGQLREAVLVTDKLVKLGKLEKPGELSCDVWILRGEALVKMRTKKPEAADAYKGAIDHCEGQPRRAEALFAGARASASAGRHLEAVARFGLVEKEFPTHRLADDARLRGARAALDAGDEARFRDMLTGIAEAYPEGDVANDGLFELALFHIGKGEWPKAAGVLEKALARAPHERAYWAAGRLPYYLARAHIELGAVPQGMAELAAVVRDYPLSFYMALAYSRMASKDRAAADATLAAAIAREPPGPFTLTKGPWQELPGVTRAIELLRQGELPLARAALDKLGFTNRTAPRELLWIAGFLLARQGAFTQSHQILRTPVSVSVPQNNELVDWLEHYPSGRWRAAWEIAYPRPFAGVVASASASHGLSEAWAYAIMREESAFDPHVVSGAHAVGLMQLIVPTAKKMGEALGITADEDSLKQPSVNIPLGVHYLTVLRRQFADNPLLAIPGYNAGAGAPKKWIGSRPMDDFDLWVERIPYEETRNYTKRVIGTMAAYELLYARGKPAEALGAPLWASPAARSGAVPAAP